MRCCEDARHRLCPPSATVLNISYFSQHNLLFQINGKSIKLLNQIKLAMYQNNQIRLVYPGCDRCDWSIGIGLSAEMYRYNCQRPLDSFQMRCRSDVKNYIMLWFIGLNLFPLRLETEPSMVKVCLFYFISSVPQIMVRSWTTVSFSPLDPSLNPKHHWGLYLSTVPLWQNRADWGSHSK